jgi:hypothetical protein
MQAVPRCSACLLLFAATLSLTNCLPSRETESQRHADANTPAGKAGKAAHELAVKTEKAAAAAGRQIDKAAHQAHEGWQESAREDKEKNR